MMNDRFNLALQQYAPDRLKETREMFGTSIKTGASMLGVSPRMLGMVESRERQVTISMVFRCAQAYGVSIDYLLGLVDDPDNHGADVRKMSRWLFAQFEDVRKQQEAELMDRIATRFGKVEEFARRLADASTETWCAMDEFREVNPDFEGQRGGAKLSHRISELKALANQFNHALRQYLPVRE